MNKKVMLTFIAIIATVGIVIAASSITTPSALALKLVREKDTRSNPNSAEIRSGQEGRPDSGHGGRPAG